MSMPGDPSRDTRSKNAKAQARHRQKRKAYIVSLETTIEKLLAAMNLTREQAEALPVPQVPSRVRELEAEIQRLQLENASLRRQLVSRQVPYTGINTVPAHPSPPISPSALSEGDSAIYPSPVYSGRRRIPENDDTLDNRSGSSDPTGRSSSMQVSRPPSVPGHQNFIPGRGTNNDPLGVPSTSSRGRLTPFSLEQTRPFLQESSSSFHPHSTQSQESYPSPTFNISGFRTLSDISSIAKERQEHHSSDSAFAYVSKEEDHDNPIAYCQEGYESAIPTTGSTNHSTYDNQSNPSISHSHSPRAHQVPPLAFHRTQPYPSTNLSGGSAFYPEQFTQQQYVDVQQPPATTVTPANDPRSHIPRFPSTQSQFDTSSSSLSGYGYYPKDRSVENPSGINKSH